ncbi:E1 ubiquitin-activating protein uba2 [Physocladia obscura]|uniref:Ubiquitin-activating enzyme E1-like n=1 Tax=Physocladia obscura TaxID=109957 RepID=A0AAD5XFS9_9FUNG|nr:E1 ubiquitin-activating protein uba2 [Physocladia obscura]
MAATSAATQTFAVRDSDGAQTVGRNTWTAAGNARVLMVGAGGIGCELLKDLVLSGFKNIVIMDLDTIDVSNLNRQFLFQKQHVSKPKAYVRTLILFLLIGHKPVASESALRFNPAANIVAHHRSIFDAEFNVSWFRSFDLVMNALDNIPARKHVNLMCRAANRPLIESGTAGYLGQVAVHLKNTILLFGKEEDGDISTSPDENAKEIEDLKREADELKSIKSNLSSPDFAKLVFEKIFIRDVQRLLEMSEMWENRAPPVPLSYNTLDIERKNIQSIATGVDRNLKVWSLVENFSIFCESISILANRLVQENLVDSEFSMSFDKDDDDALDFVTAITNLRAYMYGIELQSRFKVKEMAGNIIPAISTTNAIIAGLMVLQAFKILSKNEEECKNTYLVHGGQRTQIICGEAPPKPSKTCGTCQAGYFTIHIDTHKFTLGQFVNKVLKQDLQVDGEISINESGRMIYDPDFEDNVTETFEVLKISGVNGRLLVLVDNDDDEEKNVAINFFVVHKDNAISYELDGDRNFPVRYVAKAPADERRTRTDEDEEPSNKKTKADGNEGENSIVEVEDDEYVILL